MALSVSYHSIREQMVSLSVELEDRSRICQVLEEKIKSERSKLSRVESVVEGEFMSKIKSLREENRHELSDMKKQTEHVMGQKKSRIEKCRALVEQVKLQDKSAAEARKSIIDRVNAQLADEKNAFRLGQEERRRKMLEERRHQFKESTARAMAPEFKRIEQNSERELMELEKEFFDREKETRSRMQQRLESALADETKSLRDEHHRLARESHRAILKEIDEAEQEHRRFIDALREDMEQELSARRQATREKNNVEMSSAQEQSQQGHEASQKRLRAMQATHDQEMLDLRRDHEEQVRQMRARADADRRSMEDAIRENEGPRTQVHEEEINNAAKQERDEHIQKIIRTLQSDAIRAERAAKAEFDKEMTRMEQGVEDESAGVSARLEVTRRRLRDVIETRNEIEDEVKSYKMENSKRKLKHSFEEEISVYERGIATHRQRIRDLGLVHQASIQDDGSSLRKDIDEYKQKAEETTLSMHDAEEESCHAMARLEEQHHLDLENLERKVKADITSKDEDINVLRDAVHTEKVRAKKLKKLLQQYEEEQP